MMKNIYLSRYTSRETDCKGNRKPYIHKGWGGYLLFMLLLTVLSQPAFPQTPRRTVTGTVTDQKTGKGVSYVTVKALSKADSLLSYAITAGDGAFTLAVDGRAKAVEFTLMGYETKRIGIRNMRQGMRVSLVPSGIMLKELTVKARPIERSKDTINYNVEAFKGKEDRYIEDVLKKPAGHRGGRKRRDIIPGQANQQVQHRGTGPAGQPVQPGYAQPAGRCRGHGAGDGERPTHTRAERPGAV